MPYRCRDRRQYFSRSFFSRTLMIMNWLDILIILLLTGGLLYGSREGFLKQLASLGAVLIAISCYGWLTPSISIFVEQQLDVPPKVTGTISFLLAFTSIVFVVRWAGRQLNRVINRTPLGCINRLGGAFVGVFATAIAIGFVGLCFDYVKPIYSSNEEKSKIDVRKESQLYQAMEELIPTILPFDLFREKK